MFAVPHLEITTSQNMNQSLRCDPMDKAARLGAGKALDLSDISRALPKRWRDSTANP